MKKLNLSLLRDIKRNKRQFIAASLVVLAGIALFICTYASYKNLKLSADDFYNENRLMDYLAVFQDVPDSLLSEIRSIEGVRQAERRGYYDISFNRPDGRHATLRMITVPDAEPMELNRLSVNKGTYSGSLGELECMLSRDFSKFYKLSPGSTLSVEASGREESLTVKAVVDSPEFVWVIRSARDILPASEDMGILYVSESTAKRLMGEGFRYNQVAFSFAGDSDNTIEKIKSLENRGFVLGIEKESLPSYEGVKGEITELEEVAYLFPALFLSVAAIMVFVMLKKIIASQRSQIGLLKAFGYKNKAIVAYYVKYAVLIGLFGSLAGSAIGFLLSGRMTEMYARLFNLPKIHNALYPDTVAVSIVLSLVFCGLAGLLSSRKILKIEPASAMRSEVPKAGRRILLERLTPIWKRLSFGWKMSLRNVFRSRQRTLLTILGLTMAVMLLMVSMFFLDSLDYILQNQYHSFLTYDEKINYQTAQSLAETEKVAKLKGVQHLDPAYSISVEIRNRDQKEDTLLVLTPSDNKSFHFTDDTHAPVSLKSEGIMLDYKTAEKLGAGIGDHVTVKPLLPGSKGVELEITALCKQYTAFNAYMSLSEGYEAFSLPEVVNEAYLKVDPSEKAQLELELSKEKNVITVDSKEKAYDNFKKLMALFYEFVGAMIFFGAVMGFVVVYNTTSINITEREREIASLKVLGYKVSEISRSILRENIFISLLAIVPALVVGRLACEYFGSKFSNELVSFAIVVYPKTYVIGVLAAIAFALLAIAAHIKHIKKLDMVEVLKNREG
ncbi:MAG: FtsX-like permease family protein [Clostridia bacterium]|nr:FtsX-like permease family protein [Clostridia bacterium]